MVLSAIYTIQVYKHPGSYKEIGNASEYKIVWNKGDRAHGP